MIDGFYPSDFYNVYIKIAFAIYYNKERLAIGIIY